MKKNNLRYRFFNKLAIKQHWHETNRKSFTLKDQINLILDTIFDTIFDTIDKIIYWINEKATLRGD